MSIIKKYQLQPNFDGIAHNSFGKSYDFYILSIHYRDNEICIFCIDQYDVLRRLRCSLHFSSSPTTIYDPISVWRYYNNLKNELFLLVYKQIFLLGKQFKIPTEIIKELRLYLIEYQPLREMPTYVEGNYVDVDELYD